MNATGFDLTTVAGRTTLWVDSARIDECLAYYKSHQLGSLGVNPTRGYALKELEFLRKAPFITGLTVVSPASGDFDLEPIRSLEGLRSLTVSGAVVLDLAAFRALEEFRGGWHSKLSLENCQNLTTISLRGLKAKSGDLTGIPELPSLCDLELVQANITSLLGVARYRKLQRLELDYLTKLERLDDLDRLPELKALVCQKCRKLAGYESLSVLSGLRSLRLNGCAEIPSLGFLDHMKSLEEFRFVGTNVADGNLAPLVRLRKVGFDSKRHYSHTPAELDAILRPKGGSAIARVE